MDADFVLVRNPHQQTTMILGNLYPFISLYLTPILIMLIKCASASKLASETTETSITSTSPEEGRCASVKLVSGKVISLFQTRSVSVDDYDSVREGKLKGAEFSVTTPTKCMLEICGYNWRADAPYKYGTCEWFCEGNITAPATIYDGFYQVSSIGCSCADEKMKSECSGNCTSITPEWEDDQCAMLFQERDCNSCFFQSEPLHMGTTFFGENSFTIKSVKVRDKCFVEKETNGALHFDQPYVFKYDVNGSNIDSVYHMDSENFSCNCDLPSTTTTLASTFESSSTSTSPSSEATTSGKNSDKVDPLIYILPSVGVVLFIVISGVVARYCILRRRSPFLRGGFGKKGDVLGTPDEYKLENVMGGENMEAEMGMTETVGKNQRDVMKELKNYIECLIEAAKTEGEIHFPAQHHPQVGNRNRKDSLMEQFNHACQPSHCLERDNIIIGKKIGFGHFGDVFRATLQVVDSGDGLPETVAVKQLKSLAEEYVVKSFLREIEIFQCVGNHENIVTFMGACCQNGELFILTKFCEMGSLKSYLVDELRYQILPKRDVNPPPELEADVDADQGDDYVAYRDEMLDVEEDCSDLTLNPAHLRQMLDWSEQIANGMDFLNSKKIIHVDLAVRNILLTADLTVKICDFGLSKVCLAEKDYPQSLLTGDFPVNSIAPEVLKENKQDGKKISLFIDVWAYGCTVWEIFTLGERPYSGMNLHGIVESAKIVQKLRSGERLDRPSLAPDFVYEKLKECWNEIPEERPSFKQLRDFFRNGGNYVTEL